MGDRLFDKIEELKDINRGIAENIQRLMYYVVAIGALNGTATVGSLVEKVVEAPVIQKSSEVVQNVRSEDDPVDSREKRPSTGKSIN